MQLSSLVATTLAFTDRPVRNATIIDTSGFDDASTFGEIFEGDMPNAVLSASRADGSGVQLVLILESPDADGVAGQLTYGVSQSDAQAATGDIASLFENELLNCRLFIDG